LIKIKVILQIYNGIEERRAAIVQGKR